MQFALLTLIVSIFGDGIVAVPPSSAELAASRVTSLANSGSNLINELLGIVNHKVEIHPLLTTTDVEIKPSATIARCDDDGDDCGESDNQDDDDCGESDNQDVDDGCAWSDQNNFTCDNDCDCIEPCAGKDVGCGCGCEESTGCGAQSDNCGCGGCNDCGACEGNGRCFSSSSSSCTSSCSSSDDTPCGGGCNTGACAADCACDKPCCN